MTRRVAALVGPPLALVAIAVLVFPAGGSDDSYITYGAARALADTGEIANWNGERVEQGSSLLHVVLLAVAARLTTAPVEAVGHLVPLAGGVAAVVLATCLARRLLPRAGVPAGLLTATSAYVAFWSLGGLETTLAAAALVGAVLAVLRFLEALPDQRLARGAVAIASAAALVMLRPEGGLLLGASLLGGLVLGRGRHAGRLLLLLLAVVVLSGALALWREAYFGQPLPQPVYAKASSVDVEEGVGYVQQWAVARFQLPTLVLAVGGLLLALRRPATAAGPLTVAAFLAAVGFVLLSGGDWMQGGRFLVPALPLAAVLAARALVALPWTPLGATALVAVQLLGVLSLADTRSTATPLWASSTFGVDEAVRHRFGAYELQNRVHLREAAFLPLVERALAELDDRAGTPVTVASAQVGMVPYHLRTSVPVRFVDRHSLTTRAFATCEDLLLPSHRGLGREMPYDRWLASEDRCRQPAPDVVLEFGALEQWPGLAGRYTVVGAVPTEPNVADTRLSGIDVRTAEFVAVRNDLLAG